MSLSFKNGIETEFGFSQKDYIGKVNPNGNFPVVYKSEETIRNDLNSIDSLYIYTDIVEYQIVGDENAPLLQVVSTTGTRDTVIDKIYDTPQYVPLLRNNIERIDIDIRSDLGKNIQFTSGRVVIKLHFRRKSFY
jgi:hypothetical protein